MKYENSYLLKRLNELENEFRELIDTHEHDYEQLMDEIKLLNRRLDQLEYLLKRLQDKLDFIKYGSTFWRGF